MSSPPGIIQTYDHPAQFEPLVPRASTELDQLASQVIAASYRLQGRVHASTAEQVRGLVRSMNSYYSNRIEGQGTHPLNIEKALHQHFSDKPDVALRQRVAIAHIEAEQNLERLGRVGTQALQSDMLRRAHQDLYERLAPVDRMAEGGQPIEPGALRQAEVRVGRHHAPTPGAVPAFLARADQVYGQALSQERLLVATACAHHRLAWVHPFIDGNGRACRLQTHAALFDLTQGLWSVNRGLARNQERYYQMLEAADMHRQGDLDGRGNLSEKALVAWCAFFLQTCVDQAVFMEKMLDLEGLKGRVRTLLAVRHAEGRGEGYRPEAVLPLQHMMALGPISRGDFAQMTGLGERTARKTMSQLLADGLLASDSHKAELQIRLPLDALHLLFPGLYPEAAAPE